MKKIIFLLFAFVFVYLGVMFFIQQHYNYSWIHKGDTKDNAVPTSSPKLQVAVDIPPTVEIQAFTEKNSKELPPQQEPLQNEVLPAEEQVPQQDPVLSTEHETQQNIMQETNTIQETQEIIPSQPAKEETVAEEPLAEAPLAEAPVQEKPLTLKEQLAEKDLIDVETLNKKVFLNIRYATKNNFTGKKLYKKAKCYLKRSAAKALARAADYALKADEPFYLCIYDCYRPNSVQKIMLKSTDKKGFLAKVSNHSRGMAVDLGPCDEQGEPLLTPTEFDTFSELSAAYAYDDQIPQIAIENRTALQEIMKKAGFSTISNEWWHFDYKGAKNQEVLDIKF